MIRITTLLILSFILLSGTQYAHAQLAGPGTRPHPRTTVPGTYVPATVPGTTPSYIPGTPAYVPSSPTYVPSYPSYSPGYYNQGQVQAQLNNVRQQEAQLRSELRQLEQQERALNGQLQSMYQAPAPVYNAPYNAHTEEDRHDHGKHLGWYKNGHDGGDDGD